MPVRLLRRLTGTAPRAAFRSLPSSQAPSLPLRAFSGKNATDCFPYGHFTFFKGKPLQPHERVTFIWRSVPNLAATTKKSALWIFHSAPCILAERKGLEPSASGVTGRRYNRLNYRSRWWAVQDLNLWPPPCKGGAQPTELTAPGQQRSLTVYARLRQAAKCGRRFPFFLLSLAGGFCRQWCGAASPPLFFSSIVGWRAEAANQREKKRSASGAFSWRISLWGAC